MNRAEKRRIEKREKKGNKIINITKAQLDSEKLKATKIGFNKGVDISYDIFLVSALLSLHDLWGYTSNKKDNGALDKFIKMFQLKTDCLLDKSASIEDYLVALEEETGIKINLKTDTITKGLLNI